MRPARVLLAIGALAVAGCDRKPAAVEIVGLRAGAGSAAARRSAAPRARHASGQVGSDHQHRHGRDRRPRRLGRRVQVRPGPSLSPRRRRAAQGLGRLCIDQGFLRQPDQRARYGGSCGPEGRERGEGKGAKRGLLRRRPHDLLVAHRGVDGGGSPAFFLMAFKGVAAPSESSPESDLCGTFMYAPKGG